VYANDIPSLPSPVRKQGADFGVDTQAIGVKIESGLVPHWN